MARAGLSTARVLDAAAVLVDAEGLGALTLARIAADLGVRTPSLYAHVRGIEDLRARLADRGATELAAALGRASVGRAGPDALWALAGAWRDYARAHPGLYGALQRPAPHGRAAPGAVAAEEILAAVLRGYGLVGDALVHGGRAVRSAVHGFVALELEGGFAVDLPLADSWEQLLRVLDRGLRCPNVMGMSTDLGELRVTDHPDARRYELTAGERRLGLIDYRIQGDVIAMTHAEVDPALEGRGLGSTLVRGALQDVRDRGLKVRPLCPFVADFVARHPDEVGDLLA